MATRTIVELSDDLDGSPAQHTVQFSLEGSTYEIDLNSANRERLVSALAPFAAAARRVKGTKGTVSNPVDSRAVREWAKVNGIQVPLRGRIPLRVIEQYRSAGN